MTICCCDCHVIFSNWDNRCFASLTTALDVSADYLLFGDGQRIFDVDTPAHHNNQLMEIAAELNPSQRDHVLEILEVMVPYIKN